MSSKCWPAWSWLMKQDEQQNPGSVVQTRFQIPSFALSVLGSSMDPLLIRDLSSSLCWTWFYYMSAMAKLTMRFDRFVSNFRGGNHPSTHQVPHTIYATLLYCPLSPSGRGLNKQGRVLQILYSGQQQRKEYDREIESLASRFPRGQCGSNPRQ